MKNAFLKVGVPLICATPVMGAATVTLAEIFTQQSTSFSVETSQVTIDPGQSPIFKLLSDDDKEHRLTSITLYNDTGVIGSCTDVEKFVKAQDLTFTLDPAPTPDTTINCGLSFVLDKEKEPIKITGLTIIVNPEPIPEPENFQTDSWATVINVANQGFEALKAAYGIGTFVGLTRQITLIDDVYGEQTYQVVVVGENKDVISENNNAALTFEFVRLISDDYDEAIPMPYGSDVNQWSSSPLREYLQTTFLDDFPNEVKSAIKPVIKHTVNTVEANKNGITLEETHDKIFLPSLVDIYGETGIRTSQLGISEADADLYVQEGVQYDFYQKMGPMDPADYINSLKKAGLDGQTEDYWLRSPFISGTPATYYTWSIYEYGNAGEVPTMDDEECAIAPMFCI